MPVLPNAKHERFAQALAKGLSARKAYVEAGYPDNRHNAAKLGRQAHILTRKDEILTRQNHIEQQSTLKAIEINAISKADIMGELAKIGFANVTDVVSWRSVVVMQKDAEGIPVETHVNDVGLVDSEALNSQTRAAIKSVKQTKEGLTVEMHDKRGALMDYAKMAGWVIEKKEVGGAGDFEQFTDEELRAIIEGTLDPTRPSKKRGITPGEAGTLHRPGKPH